MTRSLLAVASTSNRGSGLACLRASSDCMAFSTFKTPFPEQALDRCHKWYPYMLPSKIRSYLLTRSTLDPTKYSSDWQYARLEATHECYCLESPENTDTIQTRDHSTFLISGQADFQLRYAYRSMLPLPIYYCPQRRQITFLTRSSLNTLS